MTSEPQPKLVRLGGLDAIELKNGSAHDLTVVCLHGYGADMRDLAPLALETPVSRPLRWVFPDAPGRLEWGGRAWWPIDIAAFEAAQRGGVPRDLSREEPAGLSAAREALQGLLAGLGTPWSRLVLMGFSQGSMLAVDLALRAPERPAGVAVLSGSLVDAKSVRALAPAKKGLPFFQSHGSADPILGFAQALALEKELAAAGWVGRLLRFEGGHAIPGEALEALGAWLDGL
ncbi:MAG: esterase [Elusimicrobiota bacterium]|nr:esterase [Elusimicrobiota bacterium]